MSGVQTVEVAADDDGTRLDRWVRRKFGGVSQGQIEKMLRTGQIRVDGKRAKSSTRLETGQSVRVPPLPEVKSAPAAPRDARLSAADRDFIRSLVIYRDDDIIAINKPSGIAVQGGTKIKRHIDGLLDGLRFDAKERPKLVHRLDRDTSGVLVLARNAFSAAALAKAFRGRDVEKTYWAIVAGVPKPRRGEIDLALDKRGEAGHEKMAAGTGRRAITRYIVVENAGPDAAWLALYPETGRTHQLRVHCSAIGTPIVGDRKYGGVEAVPGGFPNADRLHLHARGLTLVHPRKGMVTIEAEPPPFMSDTMKYFGFDPREGTLVDRPDAKI